jgi:hypothetical protein
VSDLGAKLIDDYVVNGPGTLLQAIDGDPDTIHILPMLLTRIEKEAPLYANTFTEDFADYFPC